MKIKHERKGTKKANKDRKEHGDRSYSEWVRAKCFSCVFKLGFLQLIWKVSLIFMSNLIIYQ